MLGSNRAAAGRLILVALVAAVVGCKSNSGVGDQQDGAVDAAEVTDAAPQGDAAGQSDAAPQGDAAGQSDAGQSDAGGQQDAGQQQDGGGGNTCGSNGDCALTEFCEKPSCNAASGMCTPRPVACPTTEVPVCGCDGVTYWNDCLRQRDGAVMAAQGECGNGAAMCGGFGGIQCPSGAECAYLYPNNQQCMWSDPTGVCWVTPPSCPAIMIGGTWRPCYGGPTTPCESRCDAIQTESPHWYDQSCPQ